MSTGYRLIAPGSPIKDASELKIDDCIAWPIGFMKWRFGYVDELPPASEISFGGSTPVVIARTHEGYADEHWVDPRRLRSMGWNLREAFPKETPT